MKRQGPHVDSGPQLYCGVIAVCRHSSEVKLALTFRELCGCGKRSGVEEVDTGLHWPQPVGFPFVTALCADLSLLELSLENFSPKTFQ